MKNVTLNSEEKAKLVLMSVIAIYIFLWIVTFWGMAVYTIYGKNPGDIAKFWIEANKLCPWVSVLIFVAVIITAYKLIKNEKKDNDIYHKYPLTK